MAFSDVERWEGYEKLVDEISPDVTVLAGDQTWDGTVDVSYILERMPSFKRQKEGLLRRYNAEESPGLLGGRSYIVHRRGGLSSFMDRLDHIRARTEGTAEFKRLRRQVHVDGFYRFLRYAGRANPTLIVKGNHDDDYPGDYSVSRIARIRGCQEISGRAASIHGTSFLGMGYRQTHYLRELESLVDLHEGTVDALVTHCEQNRMPRLSRLKPRVIIRGHFSRGRFRVNGVPALFTQGLRYGVVDINKKISIQAVPWTSSEISERFQRSAEKRLLRSYDWLARLGGEPDE